MSRTTGMYSHSAESVLCRLCLKNNDDYYNIFTSNVASKSSVEDAIHDLVGLRVAVGDGLPATICPLCFKKLMELSDFKKICHESDADLRKFSSGNDFMSIEGEGAADDKLGSTSESKDCNRDVTEGTSQLSWSVQTTEIYIPVPDCQLSRENLLFHVKEENENPLRDGNYEVLYTPDPVGIASDALDPLATDELFHVKEENEDPLRDGNYEVLHTPDPAGIASDALDPLATDELNGLGAYRSSSMKEDQMGNDEGGYGHNNRTDLMPLSSANQPQASTASGGEEVNAESTGGILTDINWEMVGIKKETSSEENDAAKGTYTENGELIDKWTMDHDCIMEELGLPAPERVPLQTTSPQYQLAERNIRIGRSNDIFSPAESMNFTESKTGASHAGEGKNVMDRELEECGSGLLDNITSCIRPDDGQWSKKYIQPSTVNGGGATVPVVDDRCGFDAPSTPKNTLNLNTISECGRSCAEAVMGEKEEISSCVIENPSSSYTANSKLFYCDECRDGFNTKIELVKHLKIHSGASNLNVGAESSMGKDKSLVTLVSSGESNNSCEPSTSKTLKELRRDKQGLRWKGKGILVKTGGGIGETKNVRSMKRRFVVGGKPRQQRMSAKSSSCKTNLRTHVGASRGESPYSCSVCARFFTGGGDLKKHMRTHTGEKPYSCSICTMSFSHTSSLTNHMRAHSGERPFSCSVCSKSFHQSSSLNTHMRTHTGEKPYSCGKCGKSFSVSHNLTRHMRTHSEERPYSCSVCAKFFTRSDDLKEHMRTHTREKPYSCSICTMSFSHTSSLTIHMRDHSGERPFSCSVCSKSFHQSSSLNTHMRTHTGEKPYSCGDCGKSFTVKSTLVKHTRIHTGERPYSCRICSMSFTQRSSLSIHMRTHTGERPFSCCVCSKSFNQSSSLNMHMRTHTGEKPYSCGDCGKSFTMKCNLVKHTRIHTGERP